MHDIALIEQNDKNLLNIAPFSKTAYPAIPKYCRVAW